IALENSGCDAPGVMCDSFSADSRHEKPLSDGYLTLGPACAVDVDRGKVLCTVVLDGPPAASLMYDRTSAFWLNSAAHDHVYLEPRNGARLADPDSSDAACANAVFRPHKIRIDGLGPGSDFCLLSKEGHVSHVFFTNDVEPGKQISIYFVTRRQA